jgi:hypothetical protein
MTVGQASFTAIEVAHSAAKSFFLIPPAADFYASKRKFPGQLPRLLLIASMMAP